MQAIDELQDIAAARAERIRQLEAALAKARSQLDELSGAVMLAVFRCDVPRADRGALELLKVLEGFALRVVEVERSVGVLRRQLAQCQCGAREGRD